MPIKDLLSLINKKIKILFWNRLIFICFIIIILFFYYQLLLSKFQIQIILLIWAEFKQKRKIPIKMKYLLTFKTFYILKYVHRLLKDLLWKLLLATKSVTDGDGLDKLVLILLKDYRAFYTGSFLLSYLGGFSIYLGKGSINPSYPDFIGLDLLKGASWLKMLNLDSLAVF